MAILVKYKLAHNNFDQGFDRTILLILAIVLQVLLVGNNLLQLLKTDLKSFKFHLDYN